MPFSVGKQVSRFHCEFRRVLGPAGRVEWTLFDEKSSTKTFLNGFQIPHGQPIRE